MKTLYLLAILSITMVVVSCKKRVYCTDPGVYFLLKNFTDHEQSLIIIKYYQRGNNFTTPDRTIVTGNSITHSNGDTVVFSGSYGFNPSQEIEFYFPVARITKKVSDLNFGTDYYKEDFLSATEQCNNSFTFYVNGNLNYIGGAIPLDDHNPNRSVGAYLYR